MNTPPYPIQFVNLKEIIDDLRPGQWAVYSCVVKLIDGTVLLNCSVESNPSGTNIAFETLMDEAGNPFDTWVLAVQSQQ